MHFDSLDSKQQDKIKALNLDLAGALGRCEKIHQACEPLFGTMAVKKYPPKFERVGCCKCALPCDTSKGFIEDGLFCTKPKSYSTEEYKFSTMDECTGALRDLNLCELHGDMFYTQKCNQDFLRSGDFDCLPLCPFGWPDYGDKCGKVGTLYTGMPTPWVPGDQKEYVG
jgi:hypothetical protein